MPRQKLNRYELINNDPWVIQGLTSPHILFPGEKNIVLEVACGRGEYSVGLAQHFPEKLFVGIDQKGARIGVGIQRARDLGLKNVRFVCGIIHHIDRWFSPESVDEIRVVHPDPRPRQRDEKRRLTNPRFLELYKNILKPNGLLRLKTDDRDLFVYSVEKFENEGRECILKTEDLYQDTTALQDHFEIQTHYERLALKNNGKIYYGVWKKKS